MKKLKIFALIATALLCGSSARAADVFVPGFLNWDFYPNGDRVSVEGGTTIVPISRKLTLWETPVNQADNYAEKVYGFFVPPVTGDYVFDLTSDDDSDLFLSTDAAPANKRMIANVTTWNNSRQWNDTANVNIHSDVFVDANGDTPFAAGIHLIAGNHYYIEGVHHEGGGGDDFGVTYHLVGEAIPADGTAPLLTGSAIGISIPVPTSLTITTQPQSQTVPVNQDVHLSVAVQTDSQAPPTYVWSRGSVIQTNVTGSALSFIAGTADSGATFTVVVSVPGGLSVTSSVATITVSGTGTALTGLVKEELWNNKNRQDAENGNLGVPDIAITLPNFEAPTEQGNSFVQRLSAIFTPVATGDYNFIIAADDDSDLFLSTDSNAANKVLIAQEPNWSGVRVWQVDNGDAVFGLQQKNSSTFIPNNPDGTPGTTPLNPTGIHLIGGNHYYIEAIEHEGGGGDNLAVTYYKTGDALPKDPDPGPPAVPGDAPAFTNGELSATTIPGTVTIVTPPHNISVSEGVSTNFSVVATYTGELTPVYQWQFNNTDIGGANGANYPITAVASAAGTYSVIVRIPGMATNTASATLTVQTGVFITGVLKEEYYPGKSLADVLNGTTGDPTQINLLTSFEIAVNSAANYSDRVSGFFIPPVTGDYGFVLAADDNAQFFLSTSDNPSNKRMVAQEPGWSATRTWTTDNGGAAGLAQKNSTTFVDPVTGTNYATGIHLIAGNKYYMESDHNEGGGGDNNAVAYFTIDGSIALPADGEPSNMTGTNIAIVVIKATASISQQPADVSVPANRKASFTVAVTTDSTFAPTYQWRTNGVDIPNAKSATYTTPLLTTADSGVKYSVVVTVTGADPLTSSDALLTVTADTAPPVVIAAGTQTAGYVAVKFDELVDKATAETPGNYTPSAGTVASATLNNEGRVVTVAVTGAPATGGTITVNNVKDLAGNAMAAAGAPVPIFHSTITGLIDKDIGSAQVLPDGTSALTMLPGGSAALSDSEFIISAGGSDLWGNNDQIHFVGEKITGDFDEKVQLVNIEPVNRWSKAGLDVRESVDEGNAHSLAVYVSPAPVTTVDGADNATGNNLVEAASRLTRGANADGTGWQLFNLVPYAGPTQAPNPDGLGDDTSQSNIWVRLERVGNDFSGYFGHDGTTWTKFASRNDATFTNTYVGLFLTAHNDATYTNTTHFANWTRTVGGGGGGDGAKLTVAKNADGSITITWDKPGKLQSTAELKNTGTVWADVTGGATSPVTVTPAAGNLYYRVQATP